jgi:hypothetical protein
MNPLIYHTPSIINWYNSYLLLQNVPTVQLLPQHPPPWRWIKIRIFVISYHPHYRHDLSNHCIIVPSSGGVPILPLQQQWRRRRHMTWPWWPLNLLRSHKSSLYGIYGFYYYSYPGCIVIIRIIRIIPIGNTNGRHRKSYPKKRSKILFQLKAYQNLDCMDVPFRKKICFTMIVRWQRKNQPIRITGCSCRRKKKILVSRNGWFTIWYTQYRTAIRCYNFIFGCKVPTGCWSIPVFHLTNNFSCQLFRLLSVWYQRLNLVVGMDYVVLIL